MKTFEILQALRDLNSSRNPEFFLMEALYNGNPGAWRDAIHALRTGLDPKFHTSKDLRVMLNLSTTN